MLSELGHGGSGLQTKSLRNAFELAGEVAGCFGLVRNQLCCSLASLSSAAAFILKDRSHGYSMDWKYKDDLRAPQADETSSAGW